MVACACSPSSLGGWGRRTAWTQEVKVAVSGDCTTPAWVTKARLFQNKKRRKIIIFKCFLWSTDDQSELALLTLNTRGSVSGPQVKRASLHSEKGTCQQPEPQGLQQDELGTLERRRMIEKERGRDIKHRGLPGAYPRKAGFLKYS